MKKITETEQLAYDIDSTKRIIQQIENVLSSQIDKISKMDIEYDLIEIEKTIYDVKIFQQKLEILLKKKDSQNKKCYNITSLKNGETKMTRIQEIENIKEIIKNSLYMIESLTDKNCIRYHNSIISKNIKKLQEMVASRETSN
jgi:hypothetical protein